MTFTRFAVLTATAALFSASAFAQLPTSRVLTMDAAQAIAQEAMAKCRADGYKVTVLVVDGLNAPKAMLRDDGASASTTEAAKMKATATMLYNQGGVPIKVGDVTIGAVAVSGAPGGDKDAACANAALAKLADKLK